MNLKQTIRKILKEEIDRKNIFYGFVGLPNYWVSDFDRRHTDKYFEGKEYEDFYFDNFKDMDEMIGHPESLFGTRGLPVGHPKRTSRSFNDVYKQYGTAIVRVVKKEMTNESAYVRRRLSMDRLDEELEDSLNNATEMLSIFIKKGQKITLDKFKNIVVNVMMDSLHGELSDWGTEEFPYGEVFDFIKDRYQSIIKRKYDKLFPNKSEMVESELTEKCWPGYTQKGMKTMFGKRYPNCVKKKKK